MESHQPPLRRVRIFESEDVLSLLRFEVQQAGSQAAWAKKLALIGLSSIAFLMAANL